MTAPVGNRPPTPVAPQQTQQAGNTNGYDPSTIIPNDFKASDAAPGGKYTLTEDHRKAAGYHEFTAQMGETHNKAIHDRVEKKMAEWVAKNPNANKEEYTKELKRNFMVQTLVQNELKNSINKMMNEIQNKMKEMAADRFG